MKISKKMVSSLFLGLFVALGATFFGILAVDRYRTDQLEKELLRGLSAELAFPDVQASLMNRHVVKVADSTPFAFSSPRKAPESEVTYFLGAVGAQDRAFMVRVEHRASDVISIAAEKVRFEDNT